ncbi:MAG: S8 family serine peptidase, partial [Omnitrophica WOR_2 bacterium]
KTGIHPISLLVLLILFSWLIGNTIPAATMPGWEAKIDPWLLSQVSSAGQARADVLPQAGGLPAASSEFLLFLSQQADLSGAESLPMKIQKGQYVFQRLTEVARQTQPAVIAGLKKRGLSYRTYWVANMIWARGTLADIQALAQRSDIAHIYANPAIAMQTPDLPGSPVSSQDASGPEWNLQKVRASQVWAAGFTGQGVVIGGQDTGYQWDHPALKNHYRGWNGVSADHNYNWHDAIHSGGGTCGADSPAPCDDSSHGTHTMGIMVGDDGAGNQVGMAPGAKWIGCRNMNRGVGSPATYAECFEWFIAPYPIGAASTQGDPSRAPDVISNSWSCPPGEGCNPDSLLAVVHNTRLAGILVVASAGNAGPSCSTITDPIGIYPDVFTVGNTDQNDLINSSSSRGPVTVDGNNRLKPDVSAPGTSIRSSVPVNGYTSLTGTSMSAPHVAGLAALLISARPELRGQVSWLEGVIRFTAVPRPSTQSCGAESSLQAPNNTYGWGRIDAWNAYQGMQERMNIQGQASASQVSPGKILSYTLTAANLDLFPQAANTAITDELPLNTTFVSASLPFTLTGRTLHWNVANLKAGQVQQLTFAVRVDAKARGSIRNDRYGVDNAEMPSPAVGLPVETPVRLILYLTDIFKTGY